MRKLIHIKISTILICLVLSVSLAKATLIYTQDSRSTWGKEIIIDYDSGTNKQSITYSGIPSVFFASWTNRSLASILDNTSFSATLHSFCTFTSSSPFEFWEEENTKFDITFLILEPMELELTGWTSNYSINGSFELVKVDDLIPGEIYDAPASLNERKDVFFQTILETGEYNLVAQPYPWFRQNEEEIISFNANFSIIPEPASVLLLMAGAGGLFAYRRSQRRGRNHIPTRRGFR